MDKMTIGEIALAVQGTILAGSPDAEISGVSTDSRTAAAGDLFIPLVGENHDAHRFLPGARENGCESFLISRKEACPADANVILTDDTQKAMECLAKYYLDKIDVRRTAVTGSVGKTSTRDMLYYILSEKYRTGRPQKNYNNLVGVPLTVFSFDSDLEMAVFEEGMDMPGMIHDETWIARPETAIITNIGISHMERLGSQENIRKAKMEITDFFGPENVLVINASDPLLRDAAYGDYKVLRVGYEDGLDYVVKDVKDLGLGGVSFTLEHAGQQYVVPLPVPGAHNALNAGLAIAAASTFGVKTEEAVHGLAKLDLTGKRLKVRRSSYLTVIDDSYNAAPESMRSALRTLTAEPGGRKAAVLGGMNELGEGSEEAHREVGRYAAALGVGMVVGIGEKARAITEGAQEGGAEAIWFPERAAFDAAAEDLFREGDVVLVKGSNATRMDLAADRLMELGQEPAQTE